MRVDIRFESDGLEQSPEAFMRVVRLLAEAAVLANLAHLKRHRVAPLYRSGVQYRNEPPGLPDECVDIPLLYRRGFGDCLHLSAARVAELRAQGENASIKLKFAPATATQGRVFHVLVRRGNGQLEDPSRILGMGDRAVSLGLKKVGV